MMRPVPSPFVRRSLLIALIAGALALAGACSSGAPPVTGYGPGMMGGGAPGGAPDTAGASISPAQAAQLGHVTPSGAAVDRSANSVTFSGKDVAATILAAPADGPDETFRLAGLTNPTIVLPAGAHVTIELVNADAGMPHDWLVTTAQPPFGSMGMMGAPVAPVALGAATVTLPDATTSAMPTTTITFDAATPGRYTYLCTVPGHAEEGMYGTLVVTAGG